MDAPELATDSPDDFYLVCDDGILTLAAVDTDGDTTTKSEGHPPTQLRIRLEYPAALTVRLRLGELSPVESGEVIMTCEHVFDLRSGTLTLSGGMDEDDAGEELDPSIYQTSRTVPAAPYNVRIHLCLGQSLANEVLESAVADDSLTDFVARTRTGPLPAWLVNEMVLDGHDDLIEKYRSRIEDLDEDSISEEAECFIQVLVQLQQLEYPPSYSGEAEPVLNPVLSDVPEQAPIGLFSDQLEKISAMADSNAAAGPAGFPTMAGMPDMAAMFGGGMPDMNAIPGMPPGSNPMEMLQNLSGSGEGRDILKQAAAMAMNMLKQPGAANSFGLPEGAADELGAFMSMFGGGPESETDQPDTDQPDTDQPVTQQSDSEQRDADSDAEDAADDE